MKSLIVVSVLFIFLLSGVSLRHISHAAPIIQNKPNSLIVKTDSLKVSDQTEENVWDHLTIISDSRLDSLLLIHKEENKRRNGLEGFRVQIFQGTKEQALQVKARFLSMYPNEKVYVIFQTPDFRVRVGDFRTRSEALKMRSMLSSTFASSFIVDGEIFFPDLD